MCSPVFHVLKFQLPAGCDGTRQCNFSTGEMRQEDQEFKAILGNLESSLKISYVKLCFKETPKIF